MYGNVHGMRKTTIYLPDELKRDVERLAAQRGVTETELVREALRALTAASLPPKPRLPLFESDQPVLTEDIDRAPEGFGQT
jgi:hypothetical protein